MPVSLNFPLPAPSVPVGQGKSFYCLSFWMCLFLNGGLRWNGWLLWIPSCCWIEKKIESKCNMKFGDCQTMFESDLTVSQISNFHYLTIGIHILKGLSIRTRRKSKISVSRRWQSDALSKECVSPTTSVDQSLSCSFVHSFIPSFVHSFVHS